jgi:arabinofuranan 3-O-arabinosyltransferase
MRLVALSGAQGAAMATTAVLTRTLNIDDPQRRAVELACFALCVANVTALAAMYAVGAFLVDTDGRTIPTDFVNVWAAGVMALDGAPAAAYDPWLHKPVEDAAVGWHFDGHYGWHYPPPFLFIAAGLALLPYLPAHLIWVCATLPLYVASIRTISGERLGWLLALACPTLLANATVGQNGFLTAALIGGTLHFMPRQPLVAGLCLGLLTYKPHFGLLFPLIFLVDQRWKTLAAATATAALLGLASWLCFGAVAWEAFFRWLPETSRAFLSEGQADWAKLQSLFALVRVLGGSEGLAWILQGTLSVSVAAAVIAIWRRAVPYELKAAALATGTLLITPYVYLYDLLVLAVPVAFLVRLGLRTGFARHEMAGLGCAMGLLLVFPAVMAPVGLGASAVVFAIVAARAFAAVREGQNPPQLSATTCNQAS